MKIQIIAIISILLSCSMVRAETESQEDVPAISRIMNAFSFMDNADDAKEKHQNKDAIKLYAKALEAHTQLAKDYPKWKPGLIKFRTTYCNSQIQRLLAISAATSLKPKNVANKEDARIQQIISIATKHLKNNESAEARSILMKGLDTNPDNTSIRLLLGITQCQAGGFDDALMILQELVKEAPANVHARIALSAAYMGIGQVEKAKSEISTVLELQPDMREAHYNMVRILLAITPLDKTAASYHYKKAIDLGAKSTKELNFLLTPQ